MNPSADHDHAGRWCAELPHHLLNLSVTRCPHNGEWTVWVTRGDTSAPELERGPVFGPFDTASDVDLVVSAILYTALKDMEVRGLIR